MPIHSRPEAHVAPAFFVSGEDHAVIFTGPVTFTGPITVNAVDPDQITQPILAAMVSNQGVIVTALEDLQAADADLAAQVTALVADIDRLDTDFTALEAAVAAGDPTAIAAEAAKVRDAVNALTAAKANIDTTDVPPAV